MYTPAGAPSSSLSLILTRLGLVVESGRNEKEGRSLFSSFIAPPDHPSFCRPPNALGGLFREGGREKEEVFRLLDSLSFSSICLISSA